MATLHILI